MLTKIKHNLCGRVIDLPLHQKTVLVGPPGSGKSRTLEAIQILLGASEPVSTKGNPLEIIGIDDGKELVVRAAGKAIERESIRVTDRGLMTLSVAKMQQMGFDDAEALLAKLAADEIDVEALQASVAKIWPDCGGITGNPAQWLTVLIDRLATEAASETAQAAQITRGEVVEVDAATVEAAQARVDAARQRLSDARSEVGQAAAQVQRYHHASGETELLPGDVDLAGQADELKAAWRIAMDAFTEAENAANAAIHDRDFARSELRYARERFEAAKLALEAAKKSAEPTYCPHCGGEIVPAGAAEAVQAATENLKSLRDQGLATKTQFELAEKLATTAASAVEKAHKEADSALDQCNNARDAAKRIAANRDAAAYQSAKLAHDAAVLARDTAQTELDEALAVLTPLTELIHSGLRAKANEDAKAALLASGQKKRDAVKLLKEIRANLGSDVGAERLGLLSYITKLGDISVVKSGRVSCLAVQQGDKVLPWHNLSTGQQMMLFVGLAIVIGGPARILLLDSVESLGEWTAQVLEMIQNAIDDGHLSQVVLAGHHWDGWAGWVTVAV